MLHFIRRTYHFLLAFLGNIIYGFPSKRLIVIGVTGTKGKSTAVEILRAIFEAAGKKTAALSSLHMQIGESVRDNPTENTMPGRFMIQKFLRDAVRDRCTVAILEVTSQGALQYRHRFIHFDCGVFLNLHPEHIEAHGSYEKYRDAKVRFFRDIATRSKKIAKHFILNQHDGERDTFLRAVHGLGEVHYFSGEQLLRQLPQRALKENEWLARPFNADDASAAARVAEVFGIPQGIIYPAILAFKGVPGRMEVIQEKPFRVIVDYAHTPDALHAVYENLNPDGKKKMICVLGSAGGGRDVWKRPAFGKIAGAYCSTIIATNEDPYDEPPMAIIESIAQGYVPEGGKKVETLKIVDRGEAIRHAITIAKRGSTVIITGKGSERWIHGPKGEKTAWSDKETVLSALNETREE
ncbi:MAG: UDP-N-acetylmuramyl-tripeptide synthetase [Patescibacteria group bacterium]